MNQEFIIDGKRYISSKRSGHIWGYTNDYIARLCREGKVDGKLVSRTWYVEEDSFKKYLEEIDDKKNLRRSIQSEISTHVYKKINSLDWANVAHLSSSAPLIKSPNFNESTLPKPSFSPLKIVKDDSPLFPELLTEQKTFSSETNSDLNSTSDFYTESLVSYPVSLQEFKVTPTPSFVAEHDSLTQTNSIKFYSNSFSKKVALHLVAVFLISSLSVGGWYFKDRVALAFSNKSFALGIPYSLRYVSQVGGSLFSENVAKSFLDFPTDLPTLSNFSGKSVSPSRHLANVSENDNGFFATVKGIFSSIRSFFASKEITSIAVSEDAKVKARIEDIERSKVALLSERDSSIVNVVSTTTSALPPPVKNSATKALSTPASTRIVERIIERVSTPLTVVGFSKDDLEIRLQQLSNKFSSEVSSLRGSSAGNAGSLSTVYNAIALTNRVDQLTGVAFRGGSIVGTPVSGSTFSGTSVSSDAGTFGTLTVSGATSTFANGISLTSGCFLMPNGTCLTGGSSSGGTDANWVYFNETGIRLATSTNQVLVGASATSSLAAFEVAGNQYILGNLGIGTTSPYTKLGVAGEVVAQNFTATSTSSNSSFQGLTFTNATGTNATTTGSLNIGNVLTISGSASSTISSGLNVSALNVTGSATSTFAQGINLSNGCFSINGACISTSSGITSLAGQYSTGQSGATQTFATSTDANIILTVTSSGGVHTFTPSWTGTLSVARGGTAISNPTTAGVLLGNYAGTGYMQIATSSLGLLSSDIAEGSNLFYTDVRVNSYINSSSTIPKTYSTNTFTGSQIFDNITRSTTTNATTTNFYSTNAVITSATLGTTSLTNFTSTNLSTSTIAGGLTIAGSGFVYQQATGNVGVGTSSPSTIFSVSGNAYFDGGIGIGAVRSSPGLTIASLANCIGGNALQTDGSGSLSCGSVTTGGASVGGGWSSVDADQSVGLSTTTYRVAVGATSSPYAKFSVLSGSSGTTTMALLPVSGQSANILDIYNTSGALYSVLTAGHNFGLGTTSPYARLSVVGEVVARNFTATSTTNVSSFGQILALSSTTLQNLTFLNATGTSATTTNFFASVGSFTNSFISGLATLGNLFVSGSSTLQNFTAVNSTSTNATSTSFSAGILTVTGSATSTFTAGINTSALNVTGVATSTFANGISLTSGCVYVNGTCVGGSSHTGTGSSGQVTFWSGSIAQSGSDNFLYDNSYGGLGIGTTTPKWNLQVSSSTASQLTISDPSLVTNNHWSFRNAGGLFYLATSSASTFATSSTPALTLNTNGFLGIGTSSPSQALSVNGSGYFAGSSLNIGTSTGSAAQFQIGGLGILTRVGTAIIGGDLTGNARGTNALDVQSSRGVVTQVASGDASSVFGYRNTASGSNSSAIGFVNTSSGTYSSASGYLNTASGISSSAIGFANTVSGAYSSAFGNQNIASGYLSSAFGRLNTVSATNTSAFGYVNTASATSSSAFGTSNTASGINSSVFGMKNTASAIGSSAFGSFITNSIASSTQIGPSDASKLTITYGGYTGLGTTTPQWLLQLASSTNSQLTLSDPSSFTNNHWSLRNAGGLFYLATSSASTFATSTTPALTINANGFLGIGTSSPSQALSVVGNTYLDSQLITLGRSSNTNLQVNYTRTSTSTIPSSVNAWSLATSLTATRPIFSVDTTNTRVGINTLAPNATLLVNATTNTTPTAWTGLTTIGAQGSSGVGLSIRETSAGVEAGFSIASAGTVTLGTRTTNNLGFVTNNTTKATLTTLGLLGVGTTTPQWTLQVASSTDAYLALTHTNAGTNLKHWLLSSIDGLFRIGTSSDDFTSTSTAFVLDTNGFLGIGTSSPSQALSVSGNAYISGSATSTSLFASTASSTNLFSTTFTTGNFSGGLATLGNLLAYGSSTIGNGTQTGGLTISGGATTTGNAYFGGSVGIGTTSPAGILNAFAGVSDFRFSQGASNLTPTMSVINIGATGKAAALLAGTTGAAFDFDSSGNFYIMAESKSAFYANSVGDGSIFMTVNGTSGNVGIGDTTPDYLLDVAGTAGFDGLLTMTGSAANIALGSNYLSGDGDDEGIAISSSGGLTFTNATGTNIFATTASSTNLFSTTFTTGNFSGGLATLGNLLVSGSSTLQNFTALNSTTTNATTTSLSTATLTVSGNAYFPGSGVWNSSGNVGIGMTSPVNKLHVYTTGVADGISLDGNNNPAIVLRSSGVIKGYAPVLITSGGSFFDDSQVGDMGFRSETNRVLFGVGANNSTMQVGAGSVGITGSLTASGNIISTAGVLTISGTGNSSIAGNVGLGTTTPQWLLQLASSTNSQLTISDPSLVTNNHWSFRNAGGLFYLATSSASTFATSTTPALTLNANGFLGIGTSSPSQALSVNGSGYFAGSSLNIGTSTGSAAQFQIGGLGILTRVGTAIIGGDLTGNARGTNALDVQSSRGVVTQVASGINSSAFGRSNTASGSYSSTSGYGNTASGNSSSAFGRSNTASGSYSSAFGRSNTASGSYSSTSGYGSTASGSYSSAFGYNNTASGRYSSVFGNQNTSSGNFSSAFGRSNISSGAYSSAFGNQNTASGYLSSASGYRNTASGTSSSAFGFTNTASATNTSAFGMKNTASAIGSSAFGSFITNSIASSTQIGPSDASKLTINFAGNAGLGTTTPQWLLQLATTSASQLTLSDSGDATLNHWSFRNAGGLFYLATSSASTFATSSTPALTLNVNGYLGVGTSSPSQALSVSGNAYISGNATSTTSFATTASSTNLFSTNATFGNFSGGLATLGNLLVSGSSTLQNFTALNSTTTNATTTSLSTATLTVSGNAYFPGSGIWNSSGNVGIGSTSPYAKLSVTNTGSDPSFLVEDSTSPDASPFIIQANGFTAVGTTTTNSVFSVYGGYAASEGQMFVHQNGAANNPTLRIRQTGAGGSVDNNQGLAVEVEGNVSSNIANFSYWDGTTATSRFIIRQNGNIGIGTTTPSAKLSVSSFEGTQPQFIVASSTGAGATSTHFIVDRFGNVGVGTSSPSQALSVNGSGYFAGSSLNIGTSTGSAAQFQIGGLGILTRVGTAIIGGDLTGNARGTEALDVQSSRGAVTRVASGNYSSAFGYMNTASGNRSSASGYRNTASGSYSSAFGYNNTASTDYTSAFGRNNTASAYFSSAFGFVNTASGNSSSALGFGNTASGYFSSAFGKSNLANGSRSSASGYGNTASGFRSSAFGNLNTASGDYSSALGYTNLASASRSMALGASSTASGIRSIVVGVNSSSTATGAMVFGNFITNSIASSTQIGPSDASKLTINFAGNAGLGTTTPVSLLHLTKTASGAIGPTITLDNPAGSANDQGSIDFMDSGTVRGRLGFNIQSGGNGELYWSRGTGGALSEVMRISGTSGYVGIGTTTPDAMLTVGYAGSGGNARIGNGWLCVDNNDTCTGATTAGSIYSVAALTTGVDLAEQYVTNDSSLAPGEVVSFNPDQQAGVMRASTQSAFLGVISTAPGVLLGGYEGDQVTPGVKVPVALSGRVPVKVSLEGGEIRIGDRLTISSTAGVAKKAEHSGTSIGVALSNFNTSSNGESILVFIDPQQYIAPNDLTITPEGNIGIGTTTPEYKLEVAGSVGAESFVALSTMGNLKDVSHISADDGVAILNDLKVNVHVATYRYLTESEDKPIRLGLISDEVPPEILSTNGDSIDIFKLSAFNLAATQALASKVDNLEVRIASLESIMGQGSATSTSSTGGIFDPQAMLTFLQNLGVKIENGIAYFKDVLVETLTVGSSERRTGVTLYDQVTGTPYCIAVVNGVSQTTSGKCTIIDASATSTPATPTPEIPPSGGGASGGEGGGEITDTEPPVITVNGNNPAVINVGDTYSDLGASVTDNVSNNIGVNVVGDQINTSSPATYTVTYTATDGAGNNATSTRTVNIVEVVPPPSVATPPETVNIVEVVPSPSLATPPVSEDQNP